MKTKQLKAAFTALAVIATISFGSVVKADEIALPIISKPSILEEGTQRQLTAAQIEELLPWAKDSKLFLVDLLENIQGLTTADKIERLADGITAVVGESAPKNSELLMRYALNRGLVLNNILASEMSNDAVGTADARLRVLKSSIQMALKYYDTDMAILSKKTTAPYVIFGLDYFEFLTELNKSIFDASAQYSIQRTALEWLQWDLYRDLNNASYAAQIVKINNSLKTFPNKKITDAQAIANIRLMKKVAQQLNVRATLTKLEEEKRLAQAKNEEERRLLIAKSEEERQRILREAELERLRGSRSAVDIEKVRYAIANLTASSWTTRRDAARNLSGMVGADITIAFLDRFLNEPDSDVMAVLHSALKTRINNPSYVMKAESFDSLRAKTMEVLAQAPRQSSWTKRRDMANLMGLIPTIETYRILGSWLQSEPDSDVRNAISTVMITIERTLK